MPYAFVMDTAPVVPLPTTAVMRVALTTVNEAAGVPPKLTAVEPVNLSPVMVTVVPAGPLVGVNDVMMGSSPLFRFKLILPPLQPV